MKKVITFLGTGKYELMTYKLENEQGEKLLMFFFEERKQGETGEGNCLLSYSDHRVWKDVEWKGKNIKNVIKSVL